MTPARAVERLRVEAARLRLGDSAQPIKEVARECGFGSEGDDAAQLPAPASGQSTVLPRALRGSART